ncbi:MAG: hypothetical protein ACRD3V_11905 [Vicinamibacteria bacterium]
MRSMKDEIAGVSSLQPGLYNSDAVGSGADLRGFDAATLLVQVGAYTDGSFPLVVEESSDDVTYAAVADADLVGIEPSVDAAGDADSVVELGYIGSKRFLRVSISGAVPGVTGAEIAAVVLRGHPAYAPVA